MSPLKRALLAAAIAIGAGLALSALLLRLGLIDQIAWPATAVVAVVVAAATFVTARRSASADRR